MAIAALYGSHDATLALLKNGVVRNYELERVSQERYYRLPKVPELAGLSYIYSAMIDAGVKPSEIETCYYQMVPDAWLDTLREDWPNCKFEWMPHHASHAAGAFVQSGLDRANVVSIDGGGPDDPIEKRMSAFKVFRAEKGKPLDLIKDYPWNVGIGYGLIGWGMDSIKKNAGPRQTEFLKFAGKIMGLSAYGQPCQPMTSRCAKLLRTNHKSTAPRMGIFDEPAASDDVWAASMQSAFMELIAEHVPVDLPIVMTGGCALNVCANSMLPAAFAPPNPGDNGIPFGMLCLNGHITEPVADLHYSGWGVLDKPEREGISYGIADLAVMLNGGNVIGVMQGRSEHGPRALGNRSILASPVAGIKDRLNREVKFREDFRPYAPVIRQEIAAEWFEDCPPSPYMSYSPRATEKLRELAPDIVHVDGTSRVQTVTREQNPWLHQLLVDFEEESGIPCLLNTSFNVRGKPILTTYAEAFDVLDNTELDAVYSDGVLYE